MSKTTKSYNLKQLKDWQNLVFSLHDLLNEKVLFLLEGDLAAGKTTFVGEVCRQLGFEMSSSPTFALMQEYKKTSLINSATDQAFFKSNDLKKITHVDLYRTESAEEIESAGFWELFQDQKQIIFIEWPSRISDDEWPLDWQIVRIKISVLENDQRHIEVVQD